MDPLVVMVPIEPAPDGNGLAMRAARFVSAAASRFSVVVLVVPVSGRPPHADRTRSDIPTVVVPLDPAGAAPAVADFVASPLWRRRLAAALPFPPGANRAPPTMVPRVLSALTGAGVAAGTPLHVMRSSLAPLGLAVAEHLGSAWCTLDLDDDDEAVSASLGDGDLASAYRRLVATFGPLFDAVCASAPLEAVAISQRFGFEVAVVRNAVAIAAEVTRHPAVPPELLFVGNLDYRPNVVAATTLATRIAPGVAAELRRPVNATLVGPHRPGPPLETLGRLPGIRLPGYMEDLTPLYARASAVVVPLAHGGGTSIKVLEAFAHRVPVVATRAAVRGLGVREGVHVLIGESRDELVRAVVALLRDPGRADRLAGAAWEYVDRRHSTALVDGEIAAFLADAAARAGRRPSEPDPQPGAVPNTAGLR